MRNKIKRVYGSVKNFAAMHQNSAAVGGGLMVLSGIVSAQEAAPDYSSIGAAVSVGGVVAAIIAMGAIKIGPNVARWATNKLASFFR